MKVLDERKAVTAAVDDVRQKIVSTDEFQGLSNEDQTKIQTRMDSSRGWPCPRSVASPCCAIGPMVCDASLLPRNAVGD